MSKYRTYKEIKQEFSQQRREEIEKGADKIRKELKILTTVRQVAGLTQDELAEILEVRQSYISQVDGRDNITLNTLVGVIVAMGGSIDIIVNFPEKAPVQFSQIETLFAEDKEKPKLEKQEECGESHNERNVV